MKKSPPQPGAQAFVVCREIFEDNHLGEYILFGPRSAFRLGKLPGSISFGVYAHLTGLRGQYFLELRLEDSQGEILWSVRADPPITHDDPLMPHRFAFRDLSIPINTPGRYDLLLMTEGMEIARHVLWVMADESPEQESSPES
jgi:hypothetical protein